jgi:diguanylate cyclase (GGDEF)-like protein
MAGARVMTERRIAAERSRRDLTGLGADLDALARVAARAARLDSAYVTLLVEAGPLHVGRCAARRSAADPGAAEAEVVRTVVDAGQVLAVGHGLAGEDFHAGAPVVDADGQCVGAVWGTRAVPGGAPWDDAGQDVESLSRLADVSRQVSRLLATSRREAEQLAQRRVLAAAAAGRALPAVLELLAAEVEQLLAGDVMCSVMLLNPQAATLHDGAGPSLHPDYRAAIDGLAVGEGQGACGTAVHHRTPVVITDLAVDPRWTPWRALAERHGLAACASLPVLTAGGEPLGTFALYRRSPGVPTPYEWEVLRSFGDLTRLVIERSREQVELTRLATRDPVTGLLNRSAFLQEAREALTRRPAPGTEHVLLFCDVDQFKMVNDSLGHAAGDCYLQAAADALRERLRPTDRISRFAGDAFVVLASDVPSAGAMSVADRACEAFAEPASVAGHDLQLSASVGAATTALSGSDIDVLLRDADLAMHAAKSAGRARARLCDEALRAEAQSRTELVLALRRAVTARETSVVYQPEFDIATGELVGFEALCRWTRPGMGPVSPAEFVSLAEQAGLVNALGEQVLATALADLAAWRAEQVTARGLTVWVNVSAHQVNDPALATYIGGLLRRHRLPAACLGLEVTESAVMTEGKATNEALHALRELGVRIAIDDFGTGYSSLSALRELPVDLLKIDRSFVANLDTGRSDLQIVTAILALAEALSLPVVAEGVETRDQLSLLHDLGCGTAQGFLLGRPQDAAAVAAGLAATSPWSASALA